MLNLTELVDRMSGTKSNAVDKKSKSRNASPVPQIRELFRAAFGDLEEWRNKTEVCDFMDCLRESCIWESVLERMASYNGEQKNEEASKEKTVGEGKEPAQQPDSSVEFLKPTLPVKRTKRINKQLVNENKENLTYKEVDKTKVNKGKNTMTSQCNCRHCRHCQSNSRD